MQRIRQLDAFPKINEDFYSRSLSGGIITLLSSIAMLLLFLTELSMHRTASLASFGRGLF
jgi:hypothetical protein